MFASDLSAFYAQHVTGLSLRDVSIKWGNVTAACFQYGVHLKNFETVELTNVSAASSPANRDLPALFFEKGTDLRANLESQLYRTKQVTKRL